MQKPVVQSMKHILIVTGINSISTPVATGILAGSQITCVFFSLMQESFDGIRVNSLSLITQLNKISKKYRKRLWIVKLPRWTWLSFNFHSNFN